jgi:uncharacterized protein YkwD
MTRKTRFSGIVPVFVLFVFLAGGVSVPAQFYRDRRAARPSVSSNLGSRGSLAASETEIFGLVNRERSRQGLGQLAWDDGLARLARAYSRKMAKEGFFDHYDRDGRTVTERAEEMNISDWRKIGENLFFCEGYDRFDRLAVRGWMSSPTHRENILDRKYNASGIGIAETRNGEIYITQIFVQR